MPSESAQVAQLGQGDEIAQIWETVRIKVIQLAGGDPTKVKKDLGIEEVLAYLAQAQQSDRKAAEKYSMIKNAFSQTLQCISNLGGIVASGASQVFAPSGLCFNAINFVIVAWQGYEGVFESLAGLLEKCVEFLDRLTYYEKGGMDSKLTKVACQHLQLFVEICDRTIKLRHSKRMKLMVFTKLFFLNDNDIQGLLEAMNGLISKEGHLVAAQTFNFSSEAALNSRDNLSITRLMDNKVDILVEERSDQKIEKEAQKMRDAILKALAFDDDALDKEKKEPAAAWQSTHNNFRKSVVADTGDWIFEDAQFSTWMKGTTTSSPILALEGVECSGKSHLTSTVIRELRKPRSRGLEEESDIRRLVAFYYLENDSKENAMKSNGLDNVSKALVWQFSQTDASYQKSAASICQKLKDLDPQEILTLLLFENKDRFKMNATFLIIIDGLGDTIGEPFIKLFQKVSAQGTERPIRMFITGKPRSFEILREAGGISFETIPISSRNGSDINKYIDAKMNTMDALKDAKRIGVSELRDKIRERLSQETNGDYFKLDTNLDQISNLDSEAEIDKILDNAGAERSEQIKAEITKLNNIRTPREIAEINDIISWIIYGRKWFNPAEIDAMLFLKTGEHALLSIDTKIKTKYTLFEVDRDGDVNFKSGDTSDLIPVKDDISAETIDSSREDRIVPSEVELVRHFLNTVCPPSIYRKFGFEQWLEQKLNHKSNSICRDSEANSELKLALICLKALTEEKSKRLESIVPYAVDWLLNHLTKVDLALAERQLKSKIGPSLLALFTKDDPIDSLLWHPDDTWLGEEQRRVWIYEDDAVNEILKWLKDSAVTSEITDEDGKTWVKEVISSADGSQDLLQQCAKRMALHCFQEPNSGDYAREAFMFLVGFLSKLDNLKDNQVARITQETPPTVKDISHVETWAETALGVQEKNSLWDTQNAIILHSYGHIADAEKKCRHALELDHFSWRASHLLATLTSSVEEAVEILESLTARLGVDDEWMKDAEHKKQLAQMLFDLGEKHRQARRFDVATPIFIRSVEQDPSSYQRISQLLRSYHEDEHWEQNIAFLETMGQMEHEGTQHLIEMTFANAFDSDFHGVILHTARKANRFDLLDTIYDGTIKYVKESENHIATYYLRYYYGKAQSWQVGGEDKALSTWELALNETFSRISANDKPYILPLMIESLAPIYLRKAKAAEPSSETAKDYLERISVWLQHEESERSILCPSKVFAARYHHVNGDEVTAKQNTRSQASMALEMLSDDDPENDIAAYWRLLMVFLPLEDDENALAGWAMMTFASQPQLETEEEPATRDAGEDPASNAKEPTADGDEHSEEPVTGETSAVANGEISEQFEPSTQKISVPVAENSDTARITNNDEQVDTGYAKEENSEPDAEGQIADSQSPKPIAFCDGQCGHTWDKPTQMYCCRDCIQVQFEPRCFEKLQNGTLGEKICDKSHVFLFISDWDESKMAAVPKGSVPVGNRVITLEEWKNEIQRKYVDFDV